MILRARLGFGQTLANRVWPIESTMLKMNHPVNPPIELWLFYCREAPSSETSARKPTNQLL